MSGDTPDPAAPLAPPARRRRERIGALRAGYERQNVYRLPDGLEIDQIDGYEVTRVRVFFTDVQLVAFHLQRRVAYLWVSGLGGLAFAIIDALITIYSPEGAIPGLIFGAIFVLPFLIVFGIMVRRDAVVTVYGRRTRAAMRWHWRHARAHEVYEQLVDAVRHAQEAERVRLAQADQVASPFAAPPAAEAAAGAEAAAPAPVPPPAAP